MITGMDQERKIRENRLRRMAGRQGYKLHKSRRRDPMATDFETYQLARGAVVSRSLTLDEIEARLTARAKGRG
jgi:hypothetical protein